MENGIEEKVTVTVAIDNTHDARISGGGNTFTYRNQRIEVV